MSLFFIILFMVYDVIACRDRAVNKFNKLHLKPLFCPALNREVKFTNEGFSHITYKDDKHRRSDEEQSVRFNCFLHVEEIIKKSHLYQEYRVKETELVIRKYGQNMKKIHSIEYFGFVGVIEHNKIKDRIRVVVSHKVGTDYAEFLSVVPARNTVGYRNFM
ncbi:MAG: hypothetical protein LBO09_08450 [Candidatus Peribacteria bacterium]|jgi:hypothetical protein|nr:hypothetical protein [Candidatus Peribacteria bacterium]